MRNLRLACVVLMATSVSGCAFMNATYRSLKPNEGAQMLVWHPDYSAGVGRKDKMCVQGARTATASSFNAAIELAAKAQGALGYGEAVRALNPSNPQVTFASNAYFAICQLAINDVIEAKEVPKLMTYVTEKSLDVDTTSSDGAVMNSPTIVDAITKVLADNGVEMTPELEEEIESVVEDAVEGEENPSEGDGG